MAYNELPSGWIEVGKALKKRILTYVRDNFIDHENRLNSLELSNARVEMFNFEVIGFINHYSAIELTQIGTFVANNNMTISEFKIILMNSPSSSTTDINGVLQVGLEKSTDNGATWSNILEIPAEIADGINATGSEGIATILLGEEILNEGEILRVNVISKKDVQGSFLIQGYGEIA